MPNSENIMKIIQVHNKEDIRRFLELPLKIYEGDEKFIRPLDADIEAVFDPRKNERFLGGEAVRFLLENEKGETIGRIAAFYQNQTSEQSREKAGGCGFFECINDQASAFMLFDAAKHWLKEKGMETMDGPINFGDRDKWWGLLVDGFYEPCYQCNYNPPYYREFFENYGFKLYFKQFTYWRSISEALDERYASRASKILANRGYTFEHVDKRNLEKAMQDFREVYNKAWVHHAGVAEMTAEESRKLLTSMKAILDPRLLWFSYYNGEPVGFFISIPDVNQLIVKYLNGKLTLLGKLLFLWRKKTNKCKTMFGIVFGIVPEHQRRGVEIAMIVSARATLQQKNMPYKELQLNWIGDFNPKMMRVAEQIGAKIYKTHHTYRYNFDRLKQFERYPVL